MHGINKEMCRPTSSEFLFISTCNEENDEHKTKGEKIKQKQRKENKTIYTYYVCSVYDIAQTINISQAHVERQTALRG